MIDAVKRLEELREAVKKEHSEYSEKEISAYIAGMVHGIELIRRTGEKE